MNTCQVCGFASPDVVRWVQHSNETLHWWACECENQGDCFRRFHTREEAELEKIGVDGIAKRR